MIVCHCHQVSDRTIRAAIREGAVTEECVIERCGAGGKCGGCLPAVDELITEETCATRASQPPMAHRHLQVLPQHG